MGDWLGQWAATVWQHDSKAHASCTCWQGPHTYLNPLGQTDVMQLPELSAGPDGDLVWCGVQGGKNRRDPILREDVLLQRVPQLRAKKKEGNDPFAPEFGVETWHQKNAGLPPHVKAAAAALAMWKTNPNERKHVRTNRRRK